MRGARRGAALVVLLSLLSAVSGCFGITQNPSYFPYLLPFGDIIQTHAKPPSPGYYANFDPHAIRLEVRPLKDVNGQDVTDQVRTQHVLIATVYDEKDQPRRDRRIEWMIEGVGSIMEVDESGITPGRGYKTSNKHAVSYTAYCENRLTRGDKNKSNDVMIRPGQTWCLISSPVEGDTYVTVYAPGIADWEKNKVYTTVRWVDAMWEFPPPASKPAGSEHLLVTKVYHATTRQPLTNYRVRYRIKDGPAAQFLPHGGQEVTAVSDLSGNATARIAEMRIGDQSPPAGVNNIDIEVVRPPDTHSPTGTGVVVARGTTSIEWLAPQLALSYTGPPAALLNEEVTYTATIQNFGKVPSDGISLTAPVPRGMDFVRSNPPPGPTINGEMLFALASLPPGGGAQHVVQLTFRAKELGTTSSAVTMRAGGVSDRKEVVTNITDARLAVTIEGPPRAGINQQIPLTIKVTNTGGGVLNGIKLVADLKGGLTDAGGNTSLNQVLKNPLPPGQTFTDQLFVTGRQKGRGELTLVAVTGTISATANYAVDIAEPTVSLLIEGDRKKYVGRNADFVIHVRNPTDQPLNNVLVRDQLPPEMEFVTAGDGQFNGREVVWNLGSLPPGQARDLRLTARCKDKTPAAQQNITVTTDTATLANQPWATEIFGAAGLKLEMRDLQDPVPINDRAVYEIVITNTGTETAGNVVIKGEIVGGLVRIEGGRGPTSPQIAGKTCSFPPTDIRPGERAVYQVDVLTGNQAMDGVFRCRLTAAPLQSEVVEDENTRIYIPQGAGLQPPPGGAPLPPPPPQPPNGPFGS
jgi:uncharacterized repeat protein (TIGR01451 family)